MVSAKLLYSGLGLSVAVALAAIIFIIVDKTSYCRTGDARAYTAVSEDGEVVCLPGYVFADGNTSARISCDKPPKWNWNAVPECIKIDEAIGWRCPLNSNDLTGEVFFYQPTPSDATFVSGKIHGLKTTSIQAIDVNNATESCYPTNDSGLVSPGTSVIDGDVLFIREQVPVGKAMQIRDSFHFYVRTIGSQHVGQSRAYQFDGVAVFVLEQAHKTLLSSAVYGSSSSASL